MAGCKNRQYQTCGKKWQNQQAAVSVQLLAQGHVPPVQLPLRDHWPHGVRMTDPMGCTSNLPEMGYRSTGMDEEGKPLLDTIPSGLVSSEEADLDQAPQIKMRT